MKITRYILIFSFILLYKINFAQDAQEIIKNVQSKYSSTSDATANYSQSVKYSSGKSVSSSGTIYIQKEDKYRIETKNDIIVTDGVTSWAYSKKKNQVVIDDYKNDGNTFSPNKFLFSYPVNFYSDLDGDENVSGNDCYVLKLKPRNKGPIKEARICVDKSSYLIRKITISSSESTTTYILKKITLDSGVSSSKFTFSPPEGVEIIDLR
jgi:outer membrane lipoprotein carrier protein